MPPIVCSIVRWVARGTGLLIAAGFLPCRRGARGFSAGHPLSGMDWDGTVLGVVAGMVLAWKWEFPSALISLFALGAFAAVVHMQNYEVLAIAAIPNILFLLDWKLRRAHSTRISTTE